MLSTCLLYSPFAWLLCPYRRGFQAELAHTDGERDRLGELLGGCAP
jgi:hypothetical protein